MIDMRVCMCQFSGLTIGGVVALQITAHFHKMFVVVYLYLLTSVVLQPYCSAQLNQKSVDICRVALAKLRCHTPFILRP